MGWEIAGSCLTLAILLLKAYFSGAAEQEAALKEAEAEQGRLNGLFSQAIQAMRARNAAAQSGLSNMQDQMQKDAEGKKP